MSEEDEVDRKHYRYRISLRITHPRLDPREITSNLAIKPKWTWCVGELRKTTSGTPLSGTYLHSYWYVRLRDGEYSDKSLADAIDELLGDLLPHKDYFGSLCKSGGHVEFFVGWIFYDNSGDVFGPALLAKLANMHIALSLDVYGRT
jgi:hypothetical protein